MKLTAKQTELRWEANEAILKSLKAVEAIMELGYNGEIELDSDLFLQAQAEKKALYRITFPEKSTHVTGDEMNQFKSCAKVLLDKGMTHLDLAWLVDGCQK